jgi:hypothetical protein
MLRSPLRKLGQDHMRLLEVILPNANRTMDLKPQNLDFCVILVLLQGGYPSKDLLPRDPPRHVERCQKGRRLPTTLQPIDY